ncbi:10741_t:CDS:1, partial [Scutellospora calospora]
MFSIFQNKPQPRKIIKISNNNNCNKRKRDITDDIIETLSKKYKNIDFFERENFSKLLNNSLKRQQIYD